MSDRSKVLDSTKLPSLPDVAVRLMGVSADPECSMRDVVEVVRADAGMATAIIKAVNSPYFGLNAEVSSIEGAVPLLGTSSVVALALSFSLVQEQQTKQLKSLWAQSLLKAVTAEFVARDQKFPAPCEFFLAGLLSDVGILAMLNSISNEYVPIFEEAEESPKTLYALESEKLGFDHIDIGIELTKRWAMPLALVESIRCHHLEFERIEKLKDEPYYSQAMTIRFATCVSDYLMATDKDLARAELQRFGARFFDYGAERLDEILLDVRQKTDDASAIMAIDTQGLPRPTELLAEANSRLVEIALRNHTAMSELAQQNDALKEKTVRDGLTGIHNRMAFDDRYHATVRVCLEDRDPVGVIFCDVDKFKVLNDTYGHQFGDEVLKRVAKVLESSLRETDFVARYGGEEFVVTAPQCDRKTLSEIAERLRANVEAEVIHFEGKQVPVTISAGGCVGTPEFAKTFDGIVADEMLSEADKAMYLCKQNGRNRVEVVVAGQEGVSNDISATHDAPVGDNFAHAPNMKLSSKVETL